jgi:hypothetical protein
MELVAIAREIGGMAHSAELPRFSSTFQYLLTSWLVRCRATTAEELEEDCLHQSISLASVAFVQFPRPLVDIPTHDTACLLFVNLDMHQ